MFRYLNFHRTALIIIENNNGESIYSISYDGKNFSDFENIENLIQFDSKRLQLYRYWIHISGDNIITKLHENERTSNFDFLNEKEMSFFICKKEIGNKSVVTYWQKKIINEITISLSDKKRHLIGVSGGVVPFLNQIGDRHLFLDYEIQIDNNELHKFERNTSYLGLNITQKCELYSQINLCLNGRNEFQQALDADSYNLSLEEYSQHKKFNLIGVFSLLLILILFIVNKQLNSYYSNEILTKNQKVELEMNSTSLIFQLKEEKKRKLLLLNNSGIQSKRFISFYLDRLICLMPATLKLLKLEVFPVSELNKETGKVNFNNNLICVTGTSSFSDKINLWAIDIQKQKWVSDVEIIEIIKSEENWYSFKINIIIK